MNKIYWMPVIKNTHLWRSSLGERDLLRRSLRSVCSNTHINTYTTLSGTRHNAAHEEMKAQRSAGLYKREVQLLHEKTQLLHMNSNAIKEEYKKIIK